MKGKEETWDKSEGELGQAGGEETWGDPAGRKASGNSGELRQAQRGLGEGKPEVNL